MMKTSLLHALLICSATCIGISTSVEAELITNGSMNYPPSSFGCGAVFNGRAPTDWSQSEVISQTNGVDCFDSSVTSRGFSWVSSTDGGTFVHAIGGANGGTYNEGITQEISGLVIGQQYVLSFEQSSGENSSTDGTQGYWKVSFGDETQNSSIMDAVNMNSWQMQNLLFTATATMQDITFVAQSIDTFRVDLGIDGASLTPALVPVPAAAWLFGSGLLGLIGVARRKKS